MKYFYKASDGSYNVTDDIDNPEMCMTKWRERVIELIEGKVGTLLTIEWQNVSSSDLAKLGEALGIATRL
jgi:hypothetical protein